MADILFRDDFYFVPYHQPYSFYSDRNNGAIRHYINYVVRGHMRYTTANQVFEVGPGDLYYIPMGLRYQYANDEQDVLIRSLGFKTFPEAEAASFQLQQLPREFVEEFLTIPICLRPNSAELGKFFTFLAKVVPVMKKEPLSDEPPVLQRLRAYFWKYPYQQIPQAAKYCGVAPSTLYALCQKHWGKTPNQLRQELIAKKATLFLQHSDLTVQALCDQLRISSPAYLRQLLKKYTGKTPRQIRKEAAEGTFDIFPQDN